MSFPAHALAVTSPLSGSENPLSEGGNWDNIPGWPAGGAKVADAVTGDRFDFWASLWKPTQPDGVFTDVEGILRVKRYVAHSYFDGQTRLHPSSGTSLRYSNRNGYVFLVNVEGQEWFIERVTNNSSERISDVVSSSVSEGMSIGWRSQGKTHSFWKSTGGAFAQVVSAEDGAFGEGRIAIGGFGDGLAFDGWRVGGLRPGGSPPPPAGGSVGEKIAEAIAADLASSYFRGGFKKSGGQRAAAVASYLAGGPRPSDVVIGTNKYARARVLTEDARRKA